MTPEHLEAEALKLDTEVEQAWEDEAERRYQQYLEGAMDAVPAADALREIRAELSR